MPLYEEKLISPLAVRFTQEHIKTSFKDGRIVEEAIPQIEACPAESDDYDLVLSTPFPEIEIVRWDHSHCAGDSTGHWFTLDNRRLYCLQRAAIQHWPLRVAAKVEILYADSGAAKKKYDSTSHGESVTVAHSCKEAPLFWWDWRGKVPPERTCADVAHVADQSAAWRAVACDDEKMAVDALSDAASGCDSILARALAFEYALQNRECIGRVTAKTERSATPSTAATTEDDEVEGLRTDTRAVGRKRGTARGCRGGGAGRVRGRSSSPAIQTMEERSALTAEALVEITQQLQAPAADGKLRIPSWQVRYGRHLGPLRKFLESQPDVCSLIYEDDGSFRVCRVEATRVDAGTLAEQAAAEIHAQLGPHEEGKNVRIPNWQDLYGHTLGPFKAFVRSRPDEFVIVPVVGRLFKVALAGDCGRPAYAA